jgi:hypothetical protein
MRVAVAARSFNRNPQLRAELQARYPGTTFSEEQEILDGDQLVAFAWTSAYCRNCRSFG